MHSTTITLTMFELGDTGWTTQAHSRRVTNPLGKLWHIVQLLLLLVSSIFASHSFLGVAQHNDAQQLGQACCTLPEDPILWKTLVHLCKTSTPPHCPRGTRSWSCPSGAWSGGSTNLTLPRNSPERAQHRVPGCGVRGRRRTTEGCQCQEGRQNACHGHHWVSGRRQGGRGAFHPMHTHIEPLCMPVACVYHMSLQHTATFACEMGTFTDILECSHVCAIDCVCRVCRPPS